MRHIDKQRIFGGLFAFSGVLSVLPDKDITIALFAVPIGLFFMFTNRKILEFDIFTSYDDTFTAYRYDKYRLFRTAEHNFVTKQDAIKYAELHMLDEVIDNMTEEIVWRNRGVKNS